MPLTKEDIINIAQKLPEDFSVDDFMYEIYFRQKVEDGIRQHDEGKGIPHEEVVERMKKWLN